MKKLFKELSGQTLTKNQLIDWSIAKGITQYTVEDLIYKALDAKANIINLSKKYLEGMEEKMHEKKITKEGLLELCKELGTDKAAEEIIVEKTGCTVLTIRTYIQKWGIKGMLSKMAETDKNNFIQSLKGVKGMEEEPILTCEIAEKPIMVVDDIPLYKADVTKTIENATQKQEEFKQATTATKDKPTGKLTPVSLIGENHIYNICKTDKTVIINDMAIAMELQVPFDEFETFAAEISNFNYNYLRRFTK